MSWLRGQSGASRGAAAAATAKRITTAKEISGRGEPTSGRGSARARRGLRLVRSTSTGATPPSASADARIDRGVGHIDEEVDDDIDGGNDDADAHNRRNVERRRALEGVRSEARPGEHRLGDDGSGEETTKAKPDDG